MQQHSAKHYNTPQHLPLLARGTPIALQHIATPLRVMPSKKNIDTIKQKINQRRGEKEAKRQQNVRKGVSCLLFPLWSGCCAWPACIVMSLL